MTIPYREWAAQFHKTTFEGHDLGGHDFSVPSEWTTRHFDWCRIGEYRVSATEWYRWDPVFIPSDSSFLLPSGMDEPCAFKFEFNLGKPESNSSNTVDFDLVQRILDTPASPNYWDRNLCSGRYYDGINIFPFGYPHRVRGAMSGYLDVIIADLPKSYELWFPPMQANEYRDALFRNGLKFHAINYNPTDPSVWGAGWTMYMQMTPTLMHIQYVNAVVNSITPNYCGTASGTSLVFSGMGFDNSNADIRGGWGGATTCADRTDVIYFDGLQGQGTYTYTYTAGVPVVGQFSIDSNGQITLIARAMAKGTYEIRLYKQNVNFSGSARTFHITDYAGDWQCESDGRVSPSIRIAFLVSDDYVEEGDFRSRGRGQKGGPLLLTEWELKDKAGNTTTKRYSQTPVRAPTKIYHPKINSIGTLTRAVDDRTGLMTISDVSADFDNKDKEFSEILAQYFLKNTPFDMYHVYSHEPEAWKAVIAKMIVNDHNRPGESMTINFQDITQKYFKKKLPLYRCSEADYPDIHPDQKGWSMPEVLGLASNTDGDKLGAVEAVYVDTDNYEYLAARLSLKEVSQVYADSSLVDPANYSIVYKDGGKTYIKFNVSQGSKKITFNAKGYMFALWDSANGYVQNPAYIITFLLAYLAEIPEADINIQAYDDLADLYTAMGEDESGFLILQDERSLSEITAELNFSYGAKTFVAKDGRVKSLRKDISNFQTSLFIFGQYDCLGEPDRPENVANPVNYAKAKYGFIPWAEKYLGETESSRESSISDYGSEIEPRTAWNFPWTTSQTLVEQRLTEELLRWAYGNKKVKVWLPIYWTSQLDIMSNFRFQDLYGISSTGAGEQGRYYYVTSLTYDFQASPMRLGVEGEDLQWLLRQYFIFGDANVLTSDSWATATEADRLYGYCCEGNTGEFPSDGEPGKILIDGNLIET